MSLFSTVAERLLAPAGLDNAGLEQTLGLIHQHQVDYADLYFQGAAHESWVLEDGIIKDGSFNIERGVGVRAISGEKTGFAYAEDLNPQTLKDAALAARSIANSGGQGRVKVASPVETRALYGQGNPLDSLSQLDKLALLREADQFTRKLDSHVTQVILSLSGVYEEVLVAGSDGTLAADIRPLVRFNVSVLVEKDGRRERGSAGGGGRFGYDYFLQLDGGEKRTLGYAREAVRMALTNLEAVPAPAGQMEVVLGNGWPGVLLHEAVGHGLEGDFNRKGSSAFSGRIGQRVAAKGVTVVDNGTLADRRGSLSIDDEGTPTQENILIEDGILKGYMQDKHNARLMGVAPTGNGRRESYAHLPMPRMTNTYMLAGQHDPAEIIASVKKGIFAPNFGGGQVDITSGKFVFSASEAYLIEDGKVTRPIRGATLIGMGPEVMQKISMIGNDAKLDPGVGVCGKDGQSVPVGVGQPTLKIDGITVGGTE
ncbi:metalloprotease TldD [Gallaecimonas xiamenensis]|uniref:Microcin-processing peptidase 2 n=1 Tax=Gallaecimonas xiamenensis 3-C-1 TaxID=745411 RepID=K2JRG0_9GAMM|nr:metalloprotease TldD [Gallaecimonas xiamenensis]EKE67740.1 microcin-processing peptidase 2 [Gallaecimonas xiamenensis 3-C-1]